MATVPVTGLQRVSFRIGMALVVWCGLVIFTVTQSVLTYTAQGNPANWALTFKFATLQWAPWLAVGPVVLWFAHWLPIRRPHRARRVFAHVVAAILAAALIVGLSFALRSGVGTPIKRSFSAEFLRSVNSIAVVYWLLAAGIHAHAALQRMRSREQKFAKLETQLAEARLAALQAQLHPHFLFNTLHAIGSLMHEDPDAAEDVLTALSDLLRLSLERGAQKEVRLREDIAFLERYLEIHCIRFGERLKASVEIAPETEDLLVPSFALQPLVENAIRHAIAPRRSGGNVWIRSEVLGETLRLTVRDDGPGLANPTSVGSGIGIVNTRERLAHLYGDAQSLTVVEAPGGGVLATILLPIRRAMASSEIT